MRYFLVLCFFISSFVLSTCTKSSKGDNDNGSSDGDSASDADTDTDNDTDTDTNSEIDSDGDTDVDAGMDTDLDGDTAMSCAQICDSPADCEDRALEGPAYDSDNYICDGHCHYTGCNSDQECIDTMDSTVASILDIKWGCDTSLPIPACQIVCETVKDCDLDTPNDYAYDDYECIDGYCRILGCSSDEECEDAFADLDMGCHKIYLVPMCTQRCTVPADCAGSGMPYFDEDNYDCVDGFCLHTGCNYTGECANTFGDDWECVAP